MSEACVRVLGTVTSVHGVVHSIGVDHDAVTFDGWQLGPDARDDFARLYFAADTEAKAWAEANSDDEDDATMPGQVPSRVKHGPWCDCTPCKAEPSYEGRRATVPGQESGG